MRTAALTVLTSCAAMLLPPAASAAQETASAGITKAAIVIGVNEYDPKSGYGTLTKAKNDADELADKLSSLGYAVKKLTDKEAKRMEIRNIVRTVAESVTDPDGTLIFFFSGHGGQEKGIQYLIPTDGYFEDLEGSAVPLSAIEDFMKRSPARQKMLFIDACRNISSDSGGTSLAKANKADERFDSVPVGEGMLLLNAAARGGFSYEDPDPKGKHGIFTKFLLEGLEGKAEENGEITFESLFQHVGPEVKKYSFKFGLAQTPYKAGETSGEFLIAKVARPDPGVPPLLLYVPPALDRKSVLEAAHAASKADSKNVVFWTRDPVSKREGWVLKTSSSAERFLGRSLVFSGSARVILPPTPELVEQLKQLSEPEYRIVTEDSLDAKYELAGRAGPSGEPEYAWVRRLSDDTASPYPERLPWTYTSAAPDKEPTDLRDSAWQLGMIHRWVGSTRFDEPLCPYHLQLVDMRDPAKPKNIEPGQDLIDGQKIRLDLRADDPAAEQAYLGTGRKFWVYVFYLNQRGETKRLWPRETDAQVSQPRDGAGRTQYPLTKSSADAYDFSVTAPFETDTFLMLVTDHRINPDQMIISGVTQSRSGRDSFNEIKRGPYNLEWSSYRSYVAR